MFFLIYPEKQTNAFLIVFQLIVSKKLFLVICKYWQSIILCFFILFYFMCVYVFLCQEMHSEKMLQNDRYLSISIDFQYLEKMVFIAHSNCRRYFSSELLMYLIELKVERVIRTFPNHAYPKYKTSLEIVQLIFMNHDIESGKSFPKYWEKFEFMKRIVIIM